MAQHRLDQCQEQRRFAPGSHRLQRAEQLSGDRRVEPAGRQDHFDVVAQRRGERKFSPEELADRLLLPMLLEATRLLEDGVAANVRDVRAAG